MLLDTRNQSTTGEKGFNPNVQNQVMSPSATGGQKAGYIICSILTLGIMPLVMITRKNWFNRMQNKANQATSGIEVQLAQRRDTLVKLVDATKSSMKFEKDLLKEVTQLRNVNIKPSNAVEASNRIESAFGRLLATFEQYPKVQSTKTIQSLMESADYQEREIAAARRLYNSVANEFNEQLFVWPSVCVATKMHLHSLPLFEASATQKQDVNLKLN